MVVEVRKECGKWVSERVNRWGVSGQPWRRIRRGFPVERELEVDDGSEAEIVAREEVGGGSFVRKCICRHGELGSVRKACEKLGRVGCGFGSVQRRVRSMGWC